MKRAALVCALVLGAGTLAALPWVWPSRTVCVLTADHDCINNLRRLDGAKMQWYLEKRKETNDIPTMADISQYVLAVPICPAGGVYTLGRIDENPRCSIKGHELPQ